MGEKLVCMGGARRGEAIHAGTSEIFPKHHNDVRAHDLNIFKPKSEFEKGQIDPLSSIRLQQAYWADQTIVLNTMRSSTGFDATTARRPGQTLLAFGKLHTVCWPPNWLGERTLMP